MSYQLIDSGRFEKLEQVGPFRIRRPSPQAVWMPTLDESEWRNVDASFERLSGGDGRWSTRNSKMPTSWEIDHCGVKLQVKLTDFGHLGVFPEHASLWPTLTDNLNAGDEVLHLFAYTGASTLACAKAGAKLVHIDSSKTSIAWARENAAKNAMQDAPIRWICEDAKRFAERENKRGRRYKGILLDPPSFGRGAKGEVWKIEEHLMPLLEDLRDILADDFGFVCLSCHSPGYTGLALNNLMTQVFSDRDARFEYFEMSIQQSANGIRLPSGHCCVMTASK